MGNEHKLTIAEMIPDPALCPEVMLSGFSEFPLGTRLWFEQLIAPPGWKKINNGQNEITRILCEKL